MPSGPDLRAGRYDIRYAPARSEIGPYPRSRAARPSQLIIVHPAERFRTALE